MVNGRWECRANSVFCQALIWRRICSRRKLIWCCRCFSCRRASWSAPARVSSWATCPSMTSNWRCAFTAGSNAHSWLIDNPDRAAPDQLFHARNKTAVWTNIISVRFHHYHEVACTFHVKQHFGLAFALMANCMQSIDRGLSGGVQRHADADGARQLRLGLFQWSQPGDDDLGVGTLFHANAGAHQHGNLLLQDSCQPFVGVRENDCF